MQISFKKVLIGFLVLLVLSRTHRILEWLGSLDLGGVLTLGPLSRVPEDGRFLVTLALCALPVVLLISFLKRK
jgi:hypothetical protein